MISQKKFWNDTFNYVMKNKPQYDLWLDKYEDIIFESKETPIIDLGCGSGADTLYLKERGYEVISCDFSEKALEIISNYNDKIKHFDMQDGLPFGNKSSQVIISDLSLHYFTWKDTIKIVKEINRVLVKGGTFLCRVNSVKDINFGAGQGLEVEENFYNIDGHYKRFFNEEQLRKLFKSWEIQYIKEKELDRYSNKKVAWELCVKKV